MTKVITIKTRLDKSKLKGFDETVSTSSGGGTTGGGGEVETHPAVSLNTPSNGLTLDVEEQELGLNLATAEDSGAMSAADKIRLNSMQDNAINQTTSDGRYLRKFNNLNDVANVSTARTNLGLGTMAIRDTGAGNNEHRNNISNDERFSQLSHTHPNIVPTKLFDRPAFIEETYYTNNLHTWTSIYTTRIIGANSFITMPFAVQSDLDLKIDQIGIEITTAASTAGSAIIYIFDNLGGKPSNVLASYTVTGLNTTGFKSAVANYTFQKNRLYWFGVHFEVYCTVRCIANTGAMSLGLSNATATTNFMSLLKSVTWTGTPLTSYGTWVNSERNANVPISVRFRIAGQLVIPTGLAVENTAILGTVDVDWNTVAGATAYPVQYRIDGGTIVDVSPIPTTNSLVGYGDFADNTFVEFRVAATTSSGTSDYSGWVGVIIGEIFDPK